MDLRILTNAYRVVLCFCFIFSFRLPGIYSSSVLAVGLALVQQVLRPGRWEQLRLIYLSRAYVKLNLLVICFFLYASVITVVLMEYDFSFLSLGVSYGFYSLTAPIILIALTSGRTLEVDIIVIRAFFLQSIIIAVSFAYPAFAELMRGFKDEGQLLIADNYYGGGLRGLALSGGLFFSLSVGYSIYFLLVARQMVVSTQSYFFAVNVLVSIFSALTVGRAVFFGLGIAVIFLVWEAVFRKNEGRFKYNLKRISVCIGILATCILVLVPKDYLLSAFDSYSRFAFEMFFNFYEGKGFTTGSTDRLGEMYFGLDLQQLLIGDGRYSDKTEGYYLHTDAGYMRNVLQAGIIGIALVFYHTYVLLKISASYAFAINSRVHFDKTFYICLGLLIAGLHYKGEAAMYVIMTNNIIYLLLFENYLRVLRT